MVKTQYGDLWKTQSDYKVVTTNGFVKKNGAAVMGRGVALQAKQKFPGLEFAVGEYIKTYGNHVGLISEETGIVIFPTKSVWWEVSDLRLIERSAKELKKLTEELQDKTFAMPVPGIGNGRLAIKDVWPILRKVQLPNSVIVVLNDIELIEEIKELENS